MSGRHSSANVATVIISVCAPRQNASAEGRSKRIAIRHLVNSHANASSQNTSSGFCTLTRGDVDAANLMTPPPDITIKTMRNASSAINPMRTSRTREERRLLWARLAEHTDSTRHDTQACRQQRKQRDIRRGNRRCMRSRPRRHRSRSPLRHCRSEANVEATTRTTG